MRFILSLLGIIMSSSLLARPLIGGHGTGLLHPKGPKGLGVTHFTFADCENLPAEFDLRDFGVVPPTKDQKSCGSCWAFSKTGSLESALALSGSMLDLSEQEIVSCDRNNGGCNGGNLNDGNEYQVKHGEGLEADFPYTGRDSACKTIAVAGKGTDFKYVGAPNRAPTEREVMCALYMTKTIPWITASAGNSWGNPPTDDNGVWRTCGHGQTNHAIGIVGWKTISGKVYLKMRNSWGPSWGSTAGRPGAEKGFALIPFGCDALGEEVAYIITDQTPCQPPKVRLPSLITVYRGLETMLGIRGENGVVYEWFVGGNKIADGAMLYVSPEVDTIYTLKGHNACGTAESSVQVKVVDSIQ